jgi:hypothetical protein
VDERQPLADEDTLVPAQSGPFCLPDASIPTEDMEFPGVNGPDESDDEPGLLESNPNTIVEVEVEGGAIHFVDRALATGHELGGVAVIAAGSSAAEVARLMQEDLATPLEVYIAFVDGPVPQRLVDDHEMTAVGGDVPLEPRNLTAGSQVFRATTIQTINGECPSNFSFNFWKTGWKSWSSSYGNQISCTSVTKNIDITTWSSTKRSIGACYHNCSGCSTAGATITYYAWTGSAWSYIAGPYAMQGSGGFYGQAVYYGVSSIGFGQDQGRVRSVESGKETVYVGARAQISGGSDQC